MKNTKVRFRPETEGGAVSLTRRSWLERIGLGALLASIGGLGAAMARSLVPNILYEPPRRFKARLPEEFAEGATFLEDQRVFIFREQNVFYAVSAVCSHLGCTVQLVNLNQPKTVVINGRSVEERREFHCPCHGSKYYGNGVNYAGPAPRPLACYRLTVSPEDGQLIVDLSEQVDRNFRLTV